MAWEKQSISFNNISNRILLPTLRIRSVTTVILLNSALYLNLNILPLNILVCLPSYIQDEQKGTNAQPLT
jgi:hypothetical protein